MNHKLLFLLFLLSEGSLRAQDAWTIIQTKNGKISGMTNEQGDVHIFKGIPFAAPPLGRFRWAAPQPVKSWSGIRKCDTFSASPVQGMPRPFAVFTKEFLIPPEPISEDCLYLNVWTAAVTPREKRPVIVWLYGGGFTTGGSAVPIYNGEAMAKKGIVFVSINYRVGIFGFFVHPELAEESGHHSAGNYGLMDQMAALKWVRANIAAFGGDTDNVTIAGQSAGSISVNCLVASPLAKGLFQKAIGESGALMNSGIFGNLTLEKAEAGGVKVGEALNAPTLEELRALPAETLRRSGGFWGIVIDGYVLPEEPSNIFAAGRENAVPLLTGWNDNDAILFGPPQHADDFRKLTASQYGKDSAAFLEVYPASTDSEAAASQTELSRDKFFGVQNYSWAKAQAGTGRPKVFVYRFRRRPPATDAYKQYGAFHGAEIVYAYDNLKFLDRPWEPVDYTLSATINAYWVHFATTGDPNGSGLPSWPSFDNAQDMIMILDENPHAAPLQERAALDFLKARLTATLP